MLEVILGILGSAGGGAVTGVFGAIVSGVFQTLNAKTDIKKKELELQHEVKLQELQFQARKDETENERQIAADSLTAEAYTAAIKHDVALGKADGVWGWVNSVRALMRPFLTVVMLSLTGYITYVLFSGGLHAFIGETKVAELVEYIVNTVVYTTTTIVLFFFGARENRKRLGDK